MAVAFLFCVVLVVMLPLLVIGLVLKRSTHDRPPAPPLRPVGPQWARDPARRHEYRFWNGMRWTAEVSDRGVLSKDPVTDW